MDKYSVLDDMLFHYNADTDGDEEGVVIVYKADDVADLARRIISKLKDYNSFLDAEYFGGIDPEVDDLVVELEQIAGK